MWSLLCDIDGCLANWNDRFFDLLFTLHGPPLDFIESWDSSGPTLKKWPTYSTWDWPKKECGYTNKQIDAAWDEVTSAWWLSLRPLPGAEEALERLQWLEDRYPFQVTFVTGRYPNAREASAQWLEKHGYTRPHVLTTSSKVDVARALAANGPVFAIEDKPTLIDDYHASEVLQEVCIVSQPYNRSMGYLTWQDVGYAARRVEDILKRNAPTKAEAKDVYEVRIIGHEGAVAE